MCCCFCFIKLLKIKTNYIQCILIYEYSTLYIQKTEKKLRFVVTLAAVNRITGIIKQQLYTNRPLKSISFKTKTSAIIINAVAKNEHDILVLSNQWLSQYMHSMLDDWLNISKLEMPSDKNVNKDEHVFAFSMSSKSVNRTSSEIYTFIMTYANF